MIPNPEHTRYTLLPYARERFAVVVYSAHWRNPETGVTDVRNIAVNCVSIAQALAIDHVRKDEWMLANAAHIIELFIDVISIHETREDAALPLANAKWQFEVPITRFTRNRRPVVRKFDNKTYQNATEAAKDNGISRSALSSHLSGRKGYETVHGLEFEYAA